MSSKPVVALALSIALCEQMLPAEELQELSLAARIVGPVATPSPEEVAPLLREAEIAITSWGSPRFDGALLEQAPRLRLLCHCAGTIKPFVSDELFARGIAVTTAAAALARPVAETTVAMMVVMLKRIPWLLESRGGKEILGKITPIRELCDLSIGIIGASRVGREVIALLRNYLRLTIRVYDPCLSDQEAARLQVQRVSLEDACRCEVVSVHAPDLPATRKMLDARTLGLLPDHAVLLNTARGGIIDEDALVAEVRRRPLYVYLDVTAPEPPAADSPLRREPSILLTPHVAGAMNQSRRDMGRLTIAEALRYLRGQPLMHEVTQEMMPTQA